MRRQLPARTFANTHPAQFVPEPIGQLRPSGQDALPSTLLKATERAGDQSSDALVYTSESGHTMKRETGVTPSGYAYKRAWVLRDRDGTWLGWHAFRLDLAQAHGLKILLD